MIQPRVIILNMGMLLMSMILPVYHMVSAQTRFRPWSATLQIGLSEYNGDIGNGFFEFKISPQKFYDPAGNYLLTNQPGIGGIGVEHYLNNSFDYALMYFHGEWGYHKPDMSEYFHCRMNAVECQLKWKFLNLEEPVVSPYLMAGIGYRNVLIPKTNGIVDHTWQIPVGLGIKAHTSDHTQLTIQSYLGITGSDKGDGETNRDGSNRDFYLNHTIGFCYLFTRIPIKSNRTKCPTYLSPRRF